MLSIIIVYYLIIYHAAWFTNGQVQFVTLTFTRGIVHSGEGEMEDTIQLHGMVEFCPGILPNNERTSD